MGVEESVFEFYNHQSCLVSDINFSHELYQKIFLQKHLCDASRTSSPFLLIRKVVEFVLKNVY